jgi:2-methylcitrate dehydratase
LLAAAWQDGQVTPATFAPSRIHDPALRTFIKKLTATDDPEFTRRYPAESCSRIEVTTTGGRKLVAETNYPKGHRRNPLTDREVEGKFRGLASSVLGAQGCDKVFEEIWNLDKAATLDRLFDSLVISR